MIRRIRLTGAVILLLLLTSIACGVKNQKPNHPNQLNNFDGYAYDTLLVSQSVLEDGKSELANPKSSLTADQKATAKEVLNQAIVSYNLAVTAYKTYHSTGSGDTTLLQSQLTELISSVAKVRKAFGAKL